jgi:hypothetical protein
MTKLERAQRRADWYGMIYGDQRVVRCLLMPDEIGLLGV